MRGVVGWSLAWVLLPGVVAAADQLIVEGYPLIEGELLRLDQTGLVVRSVSGEELIFPHQQVVAFSIAPRTAAPGASSALCGELRTQLDQIQARLQRLEEAAKIHYQALRENRHDRATGHTGLSVAHWQGVWSDQNYIVSGRIQNDLDRPVGGLRVVVQLLDQRGVITWRNAHVTPDWLEPRQQGRFAVTILKPTPFSGCRVIPEFGTPPREPPPEFEADWFEVPDAEAPALDNYFE